MENSISEIIGSNYKMYPLEPLAKRIRQKILKPEKRQLKLTLIVSESGKSINF